VRIEAKKLRYGCEFFASFFPTDSPTAVTGSGEHLAGPLALAWVRGPPEWTSQYSGWPFSPYTLFQVEVNYLVNVEPTVGETISGPGGVIVTHCSALQAVKSVALYLFLTLKR